MNELRLPPRLAALARLVPPGARIVDVGTDHGLLPAWLLENRIAFSAIATDIVPGPLSRAERLMRSREIGNMSCRMCDGLAAVAPKEADTVIIAGMGGETIAEILEKASWAPRGARLLLQPMSRPELLRKALENMETSVFHESYVSDSGRIYPILAAEPGAGKGWRGAEYYTGRYDLVCDDPLFPAQLDALEKKWQAALDGLSRSGREEDQLRRAQLKELYFDLLEMRRKHYADRG